MTKSRRELKRIHPLKEGNDSEIHEYKAIPLRAPPILSRVRARPKVENGNLHELRSHMSGSEIARKSTNPEGNIWKGGSYLVGNPKSA